MQREHRKDRVNRRRSQVAAAADRRADQHDFALQGLKRKIGLPAGLRLNMRGQQGFPGAPLESAQAAAEIDPQSASPVNRQHQLASGAIGDLQAVSQNLNRLRLDVKVGAGQGHAQGGITLAAGFDEKRHAPGNPVGVGRSVYDGQVAGFLPELGQRKDRILTGRQPTGFLFDLPKVSGQEEIPGLRDGLGQHAVFVRIGGLLGEKDIKSDGARPRFSEYFEHLGVQVPGPGPLSDPGQRMVVNRNQKDGRMGRPGRPASESEIQRGQFQAVQERNLKEDEEQQTDTGAQEGPGRYRQPRPGFILSFQLRHLALGKEA
ncbi:MAG: hypothetical protein BWY73_01348 [candidate division TA06 bacterium ADurb.Bin417]|uniref:Uncharacterized protein n=1 Tax=candidate division TA06 bacterium ADurb.Bin417 TaxID=1852828 RepID=A0A1V5MAU3_UNCT6|nr:MAG: hypothetical protein BWY73_01348 [candidate division TA06 bacterium ADurb.Bin417]